ncbi:MAG: hypothetical protein HKO65_19145 [Gemmatimonadetes bacterium]|nr:hypothetical protein [Gemmatimonadota bacterium]NNM07217.1 hypothetical protein [Gemmatimonadota bacterium]
MNRLSVSNTPSGPDLSLVLTALRKARGRATVGDVVAETGLARDEVETSLRSLLETRKGNLEVGETGTLVYRFDPRLIQRDAIPFFARLREGAWQGFTRAFKAWIVLMLLVYFVIFVALIIAALVASQSRGGGRSSGRLGGRRGGIPTFRGFWFWYFFWSPGWGRGRPYYGHRWERRYGSRRGEPKVPFIKKVFAFVFGPDRPKPTQAQNDRSVIRLIRARRGVLTATELVQHSGLPLQAAEEELARLMVTHGGDVEVTKEGVLGYVFPELMVSAKGAVTEREPDPAWRRLEPPEEVTGNDAKANGIVAGINTFNLVAASTAPWFIFPRLGLAGDLVWIGLVWVPLAYSTMFFAVPALRTLAVQRRNRLRRDRNLRKVILGEVFRASLAQGGTQWVSVSGASAHVRKSLTSGKSRGPDAQVGRKRNREPVERYVERTTPDALVGAQLQVLLAEFDGKVEEDTDGSVRYGFPTIVAQLQGAEAIRKGLSLEEQKVGDIVYASDQTEHEGHERDLAAFDRELAGGTDLTHLLPDPGRIAYLDDFELVANA